MLGSVADNIMSQGALSALVIHPAVPAAQSVVAPSLQEAAVVG
jgi:hypothetical protein